MSAHRAPSRCLVEQDSRPEYPDGRPFAVCPTHDIDEIYRSVHSKGYATLSALKSGDLTKAFASAKLFRSRKLPFCNFREITTLEEEYGARSSSYFLAPPGGDSATLCG